jgi:hypothetical protein
MKFVAKSIALAALVFEKLASGLLADYSHRLTHTRERNGRASAQGAAECLQHSVAPPSRGRRYGDDGVTLYKCQSRSDITQNVPHRSIINAQVIDRYRYPYSTGSY